MSSPFLIDENLSRRLVMLLSDSFAGSKHVLDVGLGGEPDTALWDYARDNRLVVLTKDDDFQQLSAMHGHPPKVIWIRTGNCTTNEIADLIHVNRALIEAFVQDSDAAFLALGPERKSPTA